MRRRISKPSVMVILAPSPSTSRVVSRPAAGTVDPVPALFEPIEKFVEVSNLQKELYTRYGVKVEFEGREDETGDIFDECVTTIPLALTEQRERFLDLLDHIIASMVEESCPPRKPPEDWEWGGIFQGFKEHFGIELPDEIAEHADIQELAHDLFDRAEKAFEAREKEIGTELLLRVFRHIYLEELDKAWVDHLTDMDHLRDGIGLRGYGQKDPKQEYKKEGYNLFVTMVARVQSNVATKVFHVKVRQEEEEQAIEANDFARHAADLAQMEARHEEELPAGASEQPPVQEPVVTGDMECPCGSGKPFMKCHGAAEEDEASA